MVSAVSETPYQYPRAGDSLYCDALPALSMQCSSQGAQQQLNNSPLHQSGRLGKIQDSEWLDYLLQSVIKKEGLAPLGFSHHGSTQRDCGRLFQKQTLGLRVGSGHSFLSLDMQPGPPSSNRYVCYKGEQPPSLYCSLVMDPQAVRVDAFLEDWSNWDCLYLFPPHQMILRALRKMDSFRGRAFYVAPFWPNQPCFLCFSSGPRKSTSCQTLSFISK